MRMKYRYINIKIGDYRFSFSAFTFSIFLIMRYVWSAVMNVFLRYQQVEVEVEIRIER